MSPYWRVEEEQQFIKLLDSGMSIQQIADHLHRSVDAVVLKAKRLGVTIPEQCRAKPRDFKVTETTDTTTTNMELPPLKPAQELISLEEMTKIQESTPPKEALTMRQTLAKLGFNTTLLSSEKHVLSRLQGLNNSDIVTLEEAFIANWHPRFSKVFFHHQPYGKRAPYIKKVQNASLERLTKLIQVTAMLLQTKAYLFWKNPVRP